MPGRNDYMRGWGAGWGGASGTGVGNPTPGSTGFYDSRSTYGAERNPAPLNYGLGQFANSPVGNTYLEDPSQSEALWERVLAEMGGVDKFSPFGAFTQKMHSNAELGYRAGLGTNPLLKRADYFKQIAPTLMRKFQGLTYDQRGETPSKWAPPARTSPRPGV